MAERTDITIQPTVSASNITIMTTAKLIGNRNGPRVCMLHLFPRGRPCLVEVRRWIPGHDFFVAVE